MKADAIDRIADSIIRGFAKFRPNPIVAGLIIDDLGFENGTQVVLVQLRGQTRRCYYLSNTRLVVPGNCFVHRSSSDTSAYWHVIATNFQVPTLGGWGAGNGTSGGGYGPGNGGPGSPGSAGTYPGGLDPQPPGPEGVPGSGSGSGSYGGGGNTHQPPGGGSVPVPGSGQVSPGPPIIVVNQYGWGNFPWGEGG